jgi:hypothetical protein
MAITIQIIGVDRTANLGKNSLRINKRLGNKSTLTTHFNCLAGTWMPRLGQDVKVYDGATLLFGGVIDQINTQSLEPKKGGAAYIQVNISSNGYGKIPARRTASVYFTNTSCGDIFNNLVVNGLNNASFDENVTVGSITTGITLPRYSAVCKSFKEVFDELAEQSGVQWYIDDTKTINFVQEAAVTTASHTLDESGSFTDYIILGTSSDLQNYCNKVFVRGDNDSLFSIVTDTAEITARLSAEGTAYSSGVYGRIINAPDVTTETALSTIGDNALKRYGFEPIELKVRSFTSTWTVGTKIQCYLPKYDITANTEFLIEELNISRYDTDILAYDMTLTKRKTADFSSQKVERGKEFFEQIIKNSGRGGGTGGLPTGSTGTIDHYQDTTTATATVTTSETTITSKAFDLSVSSDIHMTFSAYLQVTAAVTVTGKTYLNEGTAVTTTLTFQPKQNLSGNETFAFCDFRESVSAGTTTLTVKLVSDTGTITVNAGQAAMNILVFPRELTATFTAIHTGPVNYNITIIDTIEHDDNITGLNNSLIKIDATHFALAYYGGVNDTNGYIKTFSIDGSKNISETDVITYCTGAGDYPSIGLLDSSHIALAYQGADGDGFVSIIGFDGSYNLTAISTLEHDASDNSFNSLAIIDDTHFALAYAGVGFDGYMKTFGVNGVYAITEIAALEHDTVKGTENSLVLIDATHFMLAYEEGSGYAALKTFSIDGAYGNITAIDALTHDSSTETDFSLVKIDATHFALAYSTYIAGRGYYTIYLKTFSIDGAYDNITQIDSLEHDTNTSTRSSMVLVNSTHLLLAYKKSTNAGALKTFSFDGSYDNLTEIDELELVAAADVFEKGSLCQIDESYYIIGYAAYGSDGYISTIYLD